VKPRFIIFSPMYNNENYVKIHMDSVKNQTYVDWEHVIIDDNSTDKTYSIISNELTDSRCHVIRNKANLKWVANAMAFLPHYARPDDVIVCLDGDDWFSDWHVLEYLSKIYNEGIWLTYGQFGATNPHWHGHRAEPFRNRCFRSHKWVFSHLKTFKYFLFMAIKNDDLKGPNGKYTPMTYDMAIMFPMLEMTPSDKIMFVNKILCIYNIDNPICVEKQDKSLQISLDHWFRSKTPYSILENIK